VTLPGADARSEAKSELPLSEIAGVVVCFDHVARFIVNANHWTVSFITG
jgi:hypothetical protein